MKNVDIFLIGSFHCMKSILIGLSILITITVAEAADRSMTYTDRMTGLEFVLVKGGCYQMGDTFGDGYDNEKPVHEVCVDDFYIGRYEVTNGQWKRVMGLNPSKNSDYGDNDPVDSISWSGAQNFITKMNRQAKDKYRLPTEAEWEYACRSGGRDEKFSGSNIADTVAWYWDNSRGKDYPVGQKSPNGLGIYDMSGGVWEWTLDVYDEDGYSKSMKYNPINNSGNSWIRVMRGGSRGRNIQQVRCSYRGYNSTIVEFIHTGLRVLMPVKSKK